MSHQQIDFTSPSPQEQHTCTSHRDGDWLIFRCDQCPDYERRINWKTGEMRIRGSKPHILHQGHHLPTGAELGLSSLS